MLKGKKLADIVRKLKNKNRRFKRMSLGNQRKAIARDVIVQLNTKMIVAEAENGYLQLNRSGENTFVRADVDTDVSVILEQSKCTVCGIGGMFVSAVKYNDKLSKNSVYSTLFERYTHTNYLKKWFDGEQLNSIERYFEKHVLYGHPIVDEPNDSKRLIMIMENILSNGGKFDPDKGKHSSYNSKRIST